MLREIISTELYTILLVVCLIIVAMTKLLFPKRFQDFIMLLINFRYLKVYVREQKFFNVFEVLLFTNLIIGLTIFIILFTNLDNTISKNNYLLSIKLAIGICSLIVLKIFLERIIGSVLKINSIVYHYIFQKASYKNFIGLLLVPINAILIYIWNPNQISLTIFSLLLVLINIVGILLFIKDNFKIIKNNWFYFILYLCALEISPYLILYKLYTL